MAKVCLCNRFTHSSASLPLQLSPRSLKCFFRENPTASRQLSLHFPRLDVHSNAFSSPISPSPSRSCRSIPRRNSLTVFAFASPNFVQPPQAKMGILLEVEGPMADLHRYGHLEAFNNAFGLLGLDCAKWNTSIYNDLLQRSGGDESLMVQAFFQRVGWPSTLPTKEESQFVVRILGFKSEALQKIVQSAGIPVRDGLEQFLEAAMAEGVAVGILTAYAKCGDAAVQSILSRISPSLLERVIIVSEELVEESAYGQVILGSGVSQGIDEQLASSVAYAVAAEKQRLAEEVAAVLKLKVDVDTGSSLGAKKAVAAVRAGAEAFGLPPQACVLMAGSHAGVQVAAKVAMPCVVIRSSVTARGEFSAALGAYDGYGHGALTLPRLQRLILPPS